MITDFSKIDALVKKPKQVVISVIDSRQLGNTDNMFDISAVASIRMDANELHDNFRIQTKGALNVVPGTFREVAGLSTPVYKFTVKHGKVSKPFASSSDMISLGGGQFVDNASCIWEVTGEGDTARLVMMMNTDIKSLLDTFRVRNFGYNAKMLATQPKLNAGDFASYVSDGNLQYGFVHSIRDKAANIVNMDSGKIDSASINSMIEAVAPESVKGVLRSVKDLHKYDIANMGTAALKEFFNYMSQVYPADYIRALKKAVGY